MSASASTEEDLRNCDWPSVHKGANRSSVDLLLLMLMVCISPYLHRTLILWDCKTVNRLSAAGIGNPMLLGPTV